MYNIIVGIIDNRLYVYYLRSICLLALLFFAVCSLAAFNLLWSIASSVHYKVGGALNNEEFAEKKVAVCGLN